MNQNRIDKIPTENIPVVIEAINECLDLGINRPLCNSLRVGIEISCPNCPVDGECICGGLSSNKEKRKILLENLMKRLEKRRKNDLLGGSR